MHSLTIGPVHIDSNPYRNNLICICDTSAPAAKRFDLDQCVNSRMRATYCVQLSHPCQ